MKIKDLAVCKKCKNKPTLTCPVCNKNRDRILFELNCIKEKRECFSRIHAAMIRFRMESTGCATLDMEVLDNCGHWMDKLPIQNPLYDFYERLKHSTVLELFHLFKFLKLNRAEFVKKYDSYLKTKQSEIDRIIQENELADLIQYRGYP